MAKQKVYRPAKRDLRNATTLEKIALWYQHGSEYVKLSDKEEQQRLRYKTAFTLLISHHSSTVVVPLLAKTFSISESLAYKDIRECKKLYGDINKVDKDGERYLLLEQINSAIMMARESGGQDVESLFKLLKLKSEVMGFNRDEADIPNFDDFKPHVIMIGHFPETLGIKPIADLDNQVKRFLSQKGMDNVEDATVLKDE